MGPWIFVRHDDDDDADNDKALDYTIYMYNKCTYMRIIYIHMNPRERESPVAHTHIYVKRVANTTVYKNKLRTRPRLRLFRCAPPAPTHTHTL